MKTLLQNRTTGLYFQSADHWVERADQAFAFKNSSRAVEFCIKHNLWGTQIVWELEKEMYETILVLDDPLIQLSAANHPRSTRSIHR